MPAAARLRRETEKGEKTAREKLRRLRKTGNQWKPHTLTADHHTARKTQENRRQSGNDAAAPRFWLFIEQVPFHCAVLFPRIVLAFVKPLNQQQTSRRCNQNLHPRARSNNAHSTPHKGQLIATRNENTRDRSRRTTRRGRSLIKVPAHLFIDVVLVLLVRCALGLRVLRSHGGPCRLFTRRRHHSGAAARLFRVRGS